MSLLASDVGGNIQQYPPGNLSPSEYVTTLTGQPWGNGTYVSSASSGTAYAAFSGTSGSYWASSGGGYAAGTGIYAGSSVTTDVASASYSGEWLQIQLPYAIVMSSYALTSDLKTVALLGSVDGSTWYTVDVRTLAAEASEAALSLSYTKAHSIFRLVVRSGWGSATGNVRVNSIVFMGSLNLAIQNTPIVPASGTVSFSQIKAAYGNAYGSNLHAYGSNLNAGFSFSSFRGKTAQTPSVGSNLLASVTTPLAGTNAVISPGGGIVGTAGSGSSISINLQSYADSTDGTLTSCTLSSYTGGATTVTVSGSGTTSTSTLTVGSTVPSSGTVVVSLTNRFGNVQYVTFPYCFQATPPPSPSTGGLVAMYTGESYTNGVWADITGNGNNAIVTGPVSVISSGLNGTRAYLKGTSSTRVQFPSSVLPPNYTLMHVARYDPAGSSFGRILESSNVSNNFASGFVSGYTGVAYHNGGIGPQVDWGTTTVGSSYGNNWILSVDTNNSYRANGVTMGTTGAGNPSYAQLSVNNYQPSDFGIGCIAVYNTSITAGNSSSYEVWMGSNYGIPVATTSSTASTSITLNSLGRSSNVNLASLASNCSSFSIARNPNSNATLSAGGSSLNVTGSLQSTVNYTIYVTGVSSSSNGAYTFIPINVSESASAPAPSWTTLAPWNASSNAYVITGVTTTSNLNLLNYCSVAEGGTPSFSVSSNPRSSATVTPGGLLVVAGAYRNATYDVWVNASFTSNASTASNLSSFKITESPITTSAMTLGASNTNPILTSSNAFLNYVYLTAPTSTILAGGTTAYSLITQAGSWSNSMTGIMSINSGNGQLTINPGFRGGADGTVTTYTALVTANVTLNNATASKSISIPITEASLPTPRWAGTTFSYTKSGQTMSNDTWTFNLNGLCSTAVGSLSYTVPSGGVSPSQTVAPYILSGTSNSVLNIVGGYRGGSYGITVQATATYIAANGNVITSTANSAYAFSVTEVAYPSPRWSGTSGELSNITSPVGSFTLNVAPYISSTDTNATLYYYASCASVGSTIAPSTWAPISTTLNFTAGTSGSTQTIYLYCYGQNGAYTTQYSPTNASFLVKEPPVVPVWTGTIPEQTGPFTISNISSYVSCSTPGSTIYYYATCTGSGTVTPSSWASLATSLVFAAAPSGLTQTITVYAYSQGPSGATTIANPTSSSFKVRELPAAPSVSTNNEPTYGTYTAAGTYPITWTFAVANTIRVSLSSFSSFTGTPTVSISGNTVTVTGSVAAKTAPFVTLSLTNVGTNTTMVTVTTSAYQATKASPTIPPTFSGNNGASYVYDGRFGYYVATWTFAVANATNASLTNVTGFIGTPTAVVDNNNTVVRVTGNVAVAATPNVTLVLTNVSPGFTTTSLTTGPYGATPAPPQPSTATPTLSTNLGATYGAYGGSSYPITWKFEVTNTTGVSLANVNGFLGTPPGVTVAGNLVTVTGSVAAKTAPQTKLILFNAAEHYITSSTTTSLYTAAASPLIPPTVSTNNEPTYGAYDGSSYPITWTFGVTNTTGVSLTNVMDFTGTMPSVTVAGNTVTVTGRVAAKTAPKTKLILSNVEASYITSSITTSLYTAPLASPTIPSTVSTNHGASYVYDDRFGYYVATWTFTVANATNASLSSPSGFLGTPTVSISSNKVTVTVTGNVAASATPNVTLVLTNVSSGFTTTSLTAGPYGATPAPTQPSTIPPSVTSNSVSYGEYDAYGLGYPVTWNFQVANTTSATYVSSTDFNDTPDFSLSGDTVTVSGYVTPNVKPSIQFKLQNARTYYTTTEISPSYQAGSASPVPAPTLNGFPSTFTYTAASEGDETGRTIDLRYYCRDNYNTQGCTTVFTSSGYNIINGQQLSFTTYDRSVSYTIQVNVYNQKGSAVSQTNSYDLRVQENFSGSQFAATYNYTFFDSSPYVYLDPATVSWDYFTLTCTIASVPPIYSTATITSPTTFTAFDGIVFTLTRSGSDKILKQSNNSTWSTKPTDPPPDPEISVTMEAEGDPWAPSVGRWYRDYNGLLSGLADAASAFADDYTYAYLEFFFGYVTVRRSDTYELLHDRQL